MVDEGTARTLVLIAAILQLLISILLLVVGPFLLIGGILILMATTGFGIFGPPQFSVDPLVYLAVGYGVGVIVLAVVSLVFTILWFRWRKIPLGHKTGLIVTGIIGLIFLGFIPGLLVLIGGATVSEEGA